MPLLKTTLVVFTIIIFTLTIIATVDVGFIWPVVAVSDFVQLNWRSQFNGDLLMHLLLLAAWAYWREGGGMRGGIISFFCVIWGGMFSFPYFLYLIAKNQGDMRGVLLGVNGQAAQV